VFGCGAFIVGTRLAGHAGAGIQGLAGAGFPSALAHVSGHAVATVFAFGLIESGAVAILTICASTAYSAGECAGVTASFNNRPRTATLFYAANITAALIAAGIILIPGAPLLSIALNANALATVLLPVTLVFMILLASDRQLMGRQASTVSVNVAAVAIVTFVAGCGAAYGIDSFLQAAHLIPGG
jgi:Mn2+/Fe2+ NRAMP family transporter